MKKFRFRLEPLKRIKEHMERQRQKEHGAAVRNVQVQQFRLDELDQRRLQSMDSQRSRQETPGVVSAQELLGYSRYYLKIKREKIAGVEILRGLEIEAERRRQKLIEASRERKTYEKLKERHQDKFNKATELLLAKENDEIAANVVRRYGRST